MSVKLSTAKINEALNGLLALHDDLLREPRTLRYAVIAFTCKGSVKDFDDEGITHEEPVVRIEHLEPLTVDHDAELGAQLLDRAYRIRDGRDPKPLDHAAHAQRPAG